MLEGLKEAMQYLIGVGNEAEKVQVLSLIHIYRSK